VKQRKFTRLQFDLKMRAEAERLIAEGRMPPLDKVLAAVEETRKKYRHRIIAAMWLIFETGQQNRKADAPRGQSATNNSHRTKVSSYTEGKLPGHSWQVSCATTTWKAATPHKRSTSAGPSLCYAHHHSVTA
jgi:hypothetical protein